MTDPGPFEKAISGRGAHKFIVSGETAISYGDITIDDAGLFADAIELPCGDRFALLGQTEDRPAFMEVDGRIHAEPA